VKVHQAKRRAIAVASVVTAMSLVGCASTTANNPKDPFESFNRTMFSVNEGIDTVVKPVAQGYADYVPSPIRTGIGNFFGNIADLWIAVNNYLQGKITEGSSDVSRVIVNTTMGVGGLFDVATHLDLEKHNEDFGQTLGVWGVGTGPYLFWPFIGPRDVRDTFGFLADTYTDPVWRVNNVPVRNSAVVVRFIDVRASLLPADKIVEEAAFDKYSYIRNAYLQNRLNAVYDGNPPRPKEDAE
jgi:phospholipid-binding lipoprotein MlaA